MSNCRWCWIEKKSLYWIDGDTPMLTINLESTNVNVTLMLCATRVRRCRFFRRWKRRRRKRRKNDNIGNDENDDVESDEKRRRKQQNKWQNRKQRKIDDVESNESSYVDFDVIVLSFVKLDSFLSSISTLFFFVSFLVVPRSGTYTTLPPSPVSCPTLPTSANILTSVPYFPASAQTFLKPALIFCPDPANDINKQGRLWVCSSGSHFVILREFVRTCGH